MSRYLAVGSLLLAMFAGNAAHAQQRWALVDCQPESSSVQQRFAHEYQSARPGSDLYVPKRFPQTTAAVISDFRWQVDEKYADEAQHPPFSPGEIVFREKWSRGELSLEVIRVENWRSDRCRGERPTKYFNLVRAKPTDGSPDVARVLIDERGLALEYAFFAPGMTGPEGEVWPHNLDPETRKSARWVASPASDPPNGEYVATESPAGCHELTPCFAFTYKGIHYIESVPGRLYRLPPAKEARTAAARDVRTLLEQIPASAVPFSIGDDKWLAAVEVTHPD